MKTNKMLWILVPMIIIGVGIMIFGLNNNKEVVDNNEKINSIEESTEEGATIVLDEKEGLLETTFGEHTFSEQTKLKLAAPENKEMIEKNKELSKVQEKYEMEVSVYQTKETSKIDEIKQFLVVFQNKSKENYNETLSFPCEYFLTVYENEDFLSNKNGCEEEQKQELMISPNSMHYFTIGKIFVGEKGEKTVYLETPFGIFQTEITIE